MFKVKKISTGEIFQVLDTHVDDYFNITYFLIWENNGWRWRLAKNFIPPGIEIKDENYR